MSIHQDPELKNAVLDLPQKEKDKLLLRLINKDKMLLKQLHYRLLEDEYDLDERSKNLMENLSKLTAALETELKRTRISKFKTLYRELRNASGIINEHDKITGDKQSVLDARLYILSEGLRLFKEMHSFIKFSDEERLEKYLSGRIKNAIDIYKKLHEDIQFEYKERLTDLLESIKFNRYLTENAKDLQLL